MSARRMAAEQPESYAFSAVAEKEINMWIAKYPKDRQRSALIPALWIAQKDAGGWLPEVAMRAVAATPCWLRGSDDLIAVMKRRVGPQNTITADGKLSWLEVECLGACANAPMVQISNADGDSYYEDLTAESFDALLDKLVAGEKPDYGPQNSRHTSEPEGGAQALTTDAIFNQEINLKTLPNAGKKAKITYHAADPKGRRATSAGRKTDGPTDGAPDDLKKIKGIGPKFEGDLNSKGIYYFRQIGAWKAADIKMVEAVIDSFPGRIKRDEWVKQGKALAKAAAKAKG